MNAVNVARRGSYVFITTAALWSTGALAQPVFSIFGNSMQTVAMPTSMHTNAIPQPVESTTMSEDAIEMPAHLRRQVVTYPTHEAPGTVVVDTPNTYLYLILGNGQAIRYGIGVGREGFTWAGVQTVERKTEWPDWIPPQEMLARQPYLPRFMAGGPGNPLGARALYLSGTVYRVHGTNDPKTIGKQVSSGCIRLTNEDVSDLYHRVPVGARIVVLPMHRSAAAHAAFLKPNKTIASARTNRASSLY
jgi:lipoprotein-anchoring transpeptidase ErfK/SrfK